MKRIEDEDARPDFDKVWNDFCEADYLVRDYVHLAEHFFQAGRDSLVKKLMDVEAIAASKPKRTITNLIKLDGQIYVISNDGKLFEWRSYPDLPKYKNLDNWAQFPDLPQED